MEPEKYFGDDLPICCVCGEHYSGEGEDNLSYICCECGRCGLCEFCANPENHGCEVKEIG